MSDFPVKVWRTDDLGPPLWLPGDHPVPGWAFCDVCGTLRTDSVGERCAVPGYSNCPGILRQAVTIDLGPEHPGVS